MRKTITVIADLFRPGPIWALAALLFLAPFARGGEEDLYAELVRRYERVNDEMKKVLSGVECPYVPEEYESVNSLRKNASITVGGEVRAAYSGTFSNWKDPGFDPALPARGEIDAKGGDLSVNTAKMLVDGRVGDRWRVFFDIDISGHPGLRPVRKAVNTFRETGVVGYRYEEESDNLAQAYVEMFKNGHSGFGFMVGKMKLPFGLWTRPNLFAKSFMDAPNLTGSNLVTPGGLDDGMYLPHASRFVDPVAAALVSYEMRDIIRFEAAVFQDSDSGYVGLRRSGYAKYRAESPAPRSWQLGFSILPLEGWELSAHFRNRYSRTRGVRAWTDSPHRWDFNRDMASGSKDPSWDAAAEQWSDNGGGESFGSRSNEQAFVVGLAVEVPNTELSVRAEYAHGWNQGFNKHINSDGVNLGLSYRLTPFLTLHAQGEWLHVKDRSWMAETASGWRRDTRNNRVYRTLVGAEYELGRGLTLEAGWQYEYWKATSSMGGAGGGHDEVVNTSSMFYLGSRFIF